MNGGEAVFVETSARLHFGMLDLRGARARWFGGMGAAAPAPTLLVSAQSADTLEVEGGDADRATRFARRLLAHFGMTAGAALRVHRALPPHAGLGSGTQLGLAVGRALTELLGIPTDLRTLARAMGRARRSAVGTYTFAGGGFVLEGGTRPDTPPRAASDRVAPLLARLPFPITWRCVLAVPRTAPGVNGADEEAAFAELPAPPECEVERVAHLVTSAVLPALAEADLTTFGTALTAIQETTGRWFAPVQGGTFAPGPSEELVRRMADWGATGVGQSSWGPAVYGIVDGEDRGRKLADRVRDLLLRSGTAGTVYSGPFRTCGARVWRAPVDASTSIEVSGAHHGC